MIPKTAHIFFAIHPYIIVIQPIVKLTIYRIYYFSKFQTKANIERTNNAKTDTSRRARKDRIKASTIVFKPEIDQ